MENIVLIHVADSSPVVCGEEDATRGVQDVGFPVRISQEMDGKSVDGRERFLSVRVDTSFITVVQVVEYVKEGCIAKGRFRKAHTSIGSYKTAGPIIGDNQGWTQPLSSTIGKRSQRHQHLAVHLEGRGAARVWTHEGCRVMEKDIGDSIQNATMEPDIQSLSAGHGHREVFLVQNAVALQIVRFAAAVAVVVGADSLLVHRPWTTSRAPE